jgi:hypothetical protein
LQFILPLGGPVNWKTELDFGSPIIQDKGFAGRGTKMPVDEFGFSKDIPWVLIAKDQANERLQSTMMKWTRNISLYQQESIEENSVKTIFLKKM